MTALASLISVLADSPMWYASADWWTALFTGGLLVAAVVTARIALRAATSAAETYRLESGPVIVLTKALTHAKAEHPERYVLSQDTSGKAQLRRWSADLDEPLMNAQGSTLSPHYNGRPAWPRITLELRNVGRSPAIHPQVHLRFCLSPRSNIDYQELSTPPKNAGSSSAPPWTAGRDYPYLLKNAGQVRGTVTLPIVAAGQKEYVSIESRLTAEFTILVGQETDLRSRAKIIDGTTEQLRLS